MVHPWCPAARSLPTWPAGSPGTSSSMPARCRTGVQPGWSLLSRLYSTHERVSAARLHVSISARAKRRMGRGNLPMNDKYRHINSLPSLDAEYRFGEPRLYLAPHELARLTILRSKLG